jgi:ABC-2 type transport system ATP-binding protein
MRATPVVLVESLTKRDAARTRVDSLSFELAAGQVIGILGPNGAGKTTLLKMLVGLIRPTTGRVELLGCRIGSSEFASTLRRVGALIESPALYLELTVRQNLALQARSLSTSISKSRTTEVLAMVDLTERADDRARTLSLGMKQRLGIAIALIADPALVILDEPANGLDPAGIVEIRQLVRRLADDGTSVLVSSHQLAETQQACDAILVLSGGRLVATGTIAEILRGFSSNRFSIQLHPEDVAAATQSLRASEVTFDVHGSLIRVAAPEVWTGRDLNRALTDNNVHAIEIHHDVATLEEAFLALTINQPFGGTHQAESNRTHHVAS